MDNLSVRAGASLPLKIQIDDNGAETAQLIVKKTQDAATTDIYKEAPFVDGVADITLSPTDTNIDEGTYLYQINVLFDDGNIEKYPDTSDCEGEECGFANLTICESLDIGVS